MPAGVSTPLDVFSFDGSIRPVQRALHRVICHAPSVVWHAVCRWAASQAIDADALRRRWSSDPEQVWPDGWLAQVPALAQRRGPAPTTVKALRGLEQGTVEQAVTSGGACHGLMRTLPVAATTVFNPGYLTEDARHVAALTHRVALRPGRCHSSGRSVWRRCPTAPGTC